MYTGFQGGYLLQILNLSAQVLFTASGVPAAGLRIKSHSAICAQPGAQRAGSVADVVRHALCMRARAVTSKIRFIVPPSRFVTLNSMGSDPFDTKICAGVVVAGPCLGSWLKSLTEMNAGVREVDLVYNVSGAAV